jgi:DNA-binding Lrp family transcriptional regulator
MHIAFVLIKTDTGSENEVLQSLKKVDHVVEAYAVYSGAYEIVAKITAETMDKLKEVMRSHMRRIDKIQSTMTMIVTEETPR